jgi:hypothetical protein
MALGQAAGSAASQLTHTGKEKVRDINIKDLQKELVSII